jgi:hypothetical protein
LRILEGTPSHDRKQARAAEKIKEVSGLQVDMRYIEHLHIEHMKDLDIHVLYIPDEWTTKTSETFRQVQDLMQNMDLKQVDIAMMHGMFSFQAPKGIKSIPVHREEDYLPIVKRFINIGHDHVHKTSGRILVQGSFDRIAHGEEGPKGAILCRIYEDQQQDEYFFIENKSAKIYKTIDLKSEDLDNSLVELRRELKKIPEDSYVRIRAPKTHPLYVAFDDLKVQFPMYYFSKASEKDDVSGYQIMQEAVNLSEEYIPIEITPTNIISMIVDEVSSKYNFTVRNLELLKFLLEDVKKQVS